MRFTLREETGKDLCRSCVHGQIVQGDRHEWKVCNWGADSLRVPWAVLKCSRYRAENQLSDYDAKQIGWVLQVDKKGQVMGFRPPAKDDKSD